MVFLRSSRPQNTQKFIKMEPSLFMKQALDTSSSDEEMSNDSGEEEDDDGLIPNDEVSFFCPSTLVESIKLQEIKKRCLKDRFSISPVLLPCMNRARNNGDPARRRQLLIAEKAEFLRYPNAIQRIMLPSRPLGRSLDIEVIRFLTPWCVKYGNVKPGDKQREKTNTQALEALFRRFPDLSPENRKISADQLSMYWRPIRDFISRNGSRIGTLIPPNPSVSKSTEAVPRKLDDIFGADRDYLAWRAFSEAMLDSERVQNVRADLESKWKEANPGASETILKRMALSFTLKSWELAFEALSSEERKRWEDEADAMQDDSPEALERLPLQSLSIVSKIFGHMCTNTGFRCVILMGHNDISDVNALYGEYGVEKGRGTSFIYNEDGDFATSVLPRWHNYLVESFGVDAKDVQTHIIPGSADLKHDEENHIRRSGVIMERPPPSILRDNYSDMNLERLRQDLDEYLKRGLHSIYLKDISYDMITRDSAKYIDENRLPIHFPADNVRHIPPVRHPIARPSGMSKNVLHAFASHIRDSFRGTLSQESSFRWIGQSAKYAPEERCPKNETSDGEKPVVTQDKGKVKAKTNQKRKYDIESDNESSDTSLDSEDEYIPPRKVKQEFGSEGDMDVDRAGVADPSPRHPRTPSITNITHASSSISPTSILSKRTSGQTRALLDSNSISKHGMGANKTGCPSQKRRADDRLGQTITKKLRWK